MPEVDPAAQASDVAARLAALKAQFVAQLGQTLDELTAQAQALGPELTREQMAAFHARLHKLAGSGGTFGFAALSRQAQALEVTLQGWLESAAPLAPAAWQAWRDGVLALPQTLRPDVPDSGAGILTHLPTRRIVSETPRIVLIEDDVSLGQELSRGLQQLGYEVAYYTDFAPAQAAVLAAPPDVLVADILLPAGDGTLAATQLFARLGYRLPLVFITGKVDNATRIAAAQAGGDVFMRKPVSAPQLAERIEQLLAQHRQPPGRVLIVDDDETLAEHYCLTLTAAGLLAERVSQVEAVWPALERLRPDLLLLDLHMPGCSGADLARAIRYDETWQSLPIVFLSAESDVGNQGRALGSGADEFLLKPIGDAQLVVNVKARAIRARKMAELMSQDSLTGLLKHASIKDRLAQEMDRAQRQGRVLSAVMVDIDLFKKVNDNWGHPMGDQVIKTLGHLLRQRLRRQDSVGRYGGEEFVAVLPECSQEAALRLLDDIRQRFGDVRFNSQGQAFTVTLSAGIASSEHFRSADELLAAADAALYEAKRGGRNQVRLAPPPPDRRQEQEASKGFS
jgi:diguanylate cyclase (GGDEF)-like protein